MKLTRMPAPKNNTFAAVPDAQKKSVRLMVSFTEGEKKRLMRSHRGRGRLTEYIALLALAAVDKELNVSEAI